MGPKKSNKNQEKFKVIPKVQSIDQQLIELQMKKKFYEDKLAETVEVTKKARGCLDEFQARLSDKRSINENDTEKFVAVGSDFKNQKKLVDTNYTEKLNYLKQEENRRTEQIENLNEKIKTMQENFDKEYQRKEKMLAMIRTNTEELSKFFSEQLSEIQKNLSNQILEITKNWDININEHLKKYEEGIKKFDIGKQID